MKKLTYTDEETFRHEVIEFSDEHYDIANEIYSKFSQPLMLENIPLMVRKDKKSLFFFIRKRPNQKNRI